MTAATTRRRLRLSPWLLPAACLSAVAIVLLVAFSASAPRLAGTNNVLLADFTVVLEPGQRVCQSGEAPPPDAARLELFTGAYGQPGPPLAVSLTGRTDSRVAGGYGDGRLFIPLDRSTSGSAELCVRNLGSSRVAIGGQNAQGFMPQGIATTIDGVPEPAAMQVRYFRGGSESWWELAGTVASRFGYGKALGSAAVWIALLLLAAIWAAAIALVAGRVARPVLACGLVGALAAATWAFTTPPFHVPDEPQHAAYAQYLAETGKLPRAVPGSAFSPDEGAAFNGVDFNNVVGNAEGRPPWTEASDRTLEVAMERESGRRSEGGITNAVNNPPLYYALQIPAAEAPGTFLDRLLAMRLVSALFAGLAAAFATLFVREILPGRPWALAAGGLAFALQPMLGFISGGVNNDAALFASSAALFWLLARAFRRGLDPRAGALIGTALGVGLVSKATMVGFAPGLVVAAIALVLRAGPVGRRRALKGVAAAVGAAGAWVAVYVLLNVTVWDRALWSAGGGTNSDGEAVTYSIGGFLSYVWQFYLPRLPFMTEQFPQRGLPVNHEWFQGWVGRFGWLDTSFPKPVYVVAGIVLFGVFVVAGVGAWRERARIRVHIAELVSYAALAVGLLVLLAASGYHYKLISGGLMFEQGRYLLPLGALYAGVVALAARAGGQRWGPPIAATLIVLALTHQLLALLLVVDRFYT